jgi:hypothetical protein
LAAIVFLRFLLERSVQGAYDLHLDLCPVIVHARIVIPVAMNSVTPIKKGL